MSLHPRGTKQNIKSLGLGSVCALALIAVFAQQDANASAAALNAFTVTPNPGVAGQAVTFKGDFSGGSELAAGFIDFGDGIMQSITDDDLEAGAITHVYALPGVYEVNIEVLETNGSDDGILYVLIGNGSVVNPASGLSVTATDVNGASRDLAESRFAGGVVNYAVNLTKAKATAASTDFSDIPGRATSNEPGIKLTHTFTQPGIFVATTRATDAGVEKSKVRKMITISSRDTAQPSALPDPPSTQIVMKKFQGKFLFTKSTPDQVKFTGEITLPAGFDPARAGGNSLTIGIGNVVDTITIDAKGKATPGVTVTKAKVKYPKLSGPAGGGEIATVDLTMSVADLDVAGFDTEGITATVRAEEQGQKNIGRMLQVSFLFSGAAYETLAPVDFKLSKAGDSGQIKGRTSRD